MTIDTNIDGEKGTDNEDEKLFSRSKRPRRNQTVKKPGLFGLFVGTSKYQNESLNLNYADKDAEIRKAIFEVCVAQGNYIIALNKEVFSLEDAFRKLTAE